jgi:hypothetical protein
MSCKVVGTTGREEDGECEVKCEIAVLEELDSAAGRGLEEDETSCKVGDGTDREEDGECEDKLEVEELEKLDTAV